MLNVFYKCSRLTSVTIGNSVTSIGNNAFYNCYSLQKVIVFDIAAWCGISFGADHSNPLYYAHNLYNDEDTEIKNLVIPNSVTSIGSSAFYNCSGLISVIIPNSVTVIGNSAFYNCSGLTSVTIGNGIKTIYNKAFGICPNLTDVTCYAKNVPSTNSGAFNESYIEFTTLHVPSSSINAYKNIEPWKNFKEIVKLDIPKHKLIYIVDDEIYKTFDIEEDETIIPEPVPTKEGYTFSGWSEIPETMPDHDVTVTGTFTVNKYKLVYMVNGVEYKSYEVEYGAAITPEKEPTKEGYSFSGWSEIPETMPSKDVIIKGNFTINKYKLIYMVDGEVYKSFDVTYGKKIYPEAEPQKEGYAFSGWSEIPETMPSHDVTVTGTFTLLQKCGKPVIYYEKGRLTFTCDTEGVEYVTEITDSDIKKHYESEITLTATYNISVYAKKDGFAISDVSTATLCWIDAEPKTEGVTNDVVNVPARAVLIQTDGGSIKVLGADDGTQVIVYNVNGSQVGSAISQNGVTTINTTLQSGSVVIVKVGKKSVKILLK